MHKLFSWLFLKILFAGTMFFADGASALATVDGGGGADGGSGSSGDAGAASGEGTSADSGDGDGGDSGAGDGAGGEVSADGTGTDDQDPERLIDSGDGRKIPAKYKELFEKDKDLRNTYFNYQALRKTFPGGVKEAVQLARDVEELGGLDGIQRIQDDLATYTTDAEAFNSGDPKWIEASFKENSDVSLKHFTNALEYVSEHHPEHYDHLMAKVIVNDLSNLDVRGIYQVLSSLKDNPEAKKLAGQLAEYYNSRAEVSRKAPEKQINPQQKRIDEENQRLSKREQDIRNKTINAEAGPYLKSSIQSSLSAAAKSAQLDMAKIQKEQPNRWGRFLKDVERAVHAEVLGDKRWLDRYMDALNSGDTAKCVRMINKRHDEAIRGTDDKQGVAAAIFHEWFGPPKAAGRTSGSSAASRSSSAGSSNARSGDGKQTPILVNSLPPAKEIDYSWSGTDKWAGLYRLKTGKLIQVKRA